MKMESPPKKTCTGFICLHIAETEDVNQEADKGDHEKHGGGDSIKKKTEIDLQLPDL